MNKMRYTRYRSSLLHASWVVCLLFLLSSSWVGCGVPETCQKGATRACTCEDKQGQQRCRADGTGYEGCNCSGSEQTTADREPTANEPNSTEPATDATDPTDADVQTDQSTDQTTDNPTGADAASRCPSGQVFHQSRCQSIDDFCKSRFLKSEQAAMTSPREVIMSEDGRPFFCKTKPGFFYLESVGYGTCDNDRDGWISIEAYRAVTSTIASVRNNARCQVLRINAIVYHKEGSDAANAQLQALPKDIPLVETFRNDGGKKALELPVYTDKQEALPKTRGSACNTDAECGAQICYIGHCISGRRLAPAEINTLTKACIANIDLNDNQIDDANESPSDTPSPDAIFKPLLNLGYFIELHHGHFQADYDHQGEKKAVYHIYERSRTKDANQQGLALKCQEQPDAFRPDHWKRCALRDNQRCPEGNGSGNVRNGLSHCWLKDVSRLIPSLFKCVVFDSNTDKTKQEGMFHPDNYGFSKAYSRTNCSFKASLNESDPTKRDMAFTCTDDDGQQRPDASQKLVGWACISFKPYQNKGNYLGGCTDEIAEQICGDKGVTYLSHEHNSYGLARANRECGNSTGVGECGASKQICTGGKWLDCNKCDNCPNDTAGSSKACPNGTWPAGDCKLESTPQPEVCDGLDNDCDGQIDEEIPVLPFYKDADGDTFGDPNEEVQKCKEQQPQGYVDNKLDCNDNDKEIKPGVTDICDGVDNNCDGQIDDGATREKWYEDNDTDGFGGTLKYEGCLTASKKTICTGLNTCVPVNYAHNGFPTSYKTNGEDCCDADAQAKPGQTNYFATANACGSFDWNCDKKETSEQKLCPCSKKPQYSDVASTSCSQAGKHKPWHSSSCKTCTKSLRTCELDTSHTYQPPFNFALSVKCAFCSQTETFSRTLARITVNTKSPTSTALIVFPKDVYQAGCAYHKSGAPPKCGEVASVAGTAASTPSFSGSKPRFAKGQFRCVFCKDSYSCSSSYKVSYKSNFIYAKQTASAVLIKCR